ncbi:MAG: DUF1592 domain-containing protein [Myxococcota bacterium]
MRKTIYRLSCLLLVGCSPGGGEVSESIAPDFEAALPPTPEVKVPETVEELFSDEEELPSLDPTGSSLLSRLTNDEFLTTLGNLLELSDQQINTLRAQAVLPPEQESAGLANIANRQFITQLTLTQFASATKIAVDLKLGEVTLENFNAVISCPQQDTTHDVCIRTVTAELLQRGFRGAAESEDLDALTNLLDSLVSTADDPDTLRELTGRYTTAVQFITISPKFLLFLENPVAEDTTLSGRGIANRIAYALTGGPPDAQLLNAAAGGSLLTADGRQAETERLLADPAIAARLVEIIGGWLKLDAARTDEQSIADVTEFVQSRLDDDQAYADLYRSSVSVSHLDESESEQSIGLFGLRAVIESNTNPPVASFINRGEFITERLLCADLPDDLPESAIPETPPDPAELFEANKTTACATCHQVFDNYGAALQRFDLETSLYEPDSDWLGNSFELFPIGDVSGTVAGVEDLATKLAESTIAHECFAKLWYRNAFRRELDIEGSDAPVVEELTQDWLASGGTLRGLLVYIIAHEDFAKL